MATESGYQYGERHDGGRGLRPWSRLTPTRITLVYLVLGVLALFVSDVVLPVVLTEPLLSQVQAGKGALEVLLTGALVYVLTDRHEAQLTAMAEQVDRENRELLILHRVLRHNLRNDLNVILSAVERVRESARDDEIPPACATVEQVSQRMEKYTEDARRIRLVDEGPGHRLEFDLAAVLRDVVADLDSSRSATVALPASLPVRANYMLPEAMAELLEHSLERDDCDGSAVDVSLVAADGEAVEVTIDCEGYALPEGDLEAIRHGSEDDLVHANGLGLWFVTWTIERSDGDLAFTNRPSGTRIDLTLPAA